MELVSSLPPARSRMPADVRSTIDHLYQRTRAHTYVRVPIHTGCAHICIDTHIHADTCRQRDTACMDTAGGSPQAATCGSCCRWTEREAKDSFLCSACESIRMRVETRLLTHREREMEEIHKEKTKRQRLVFICPEVQLTFFPQSSSPLFFSFFFFLSIVF